MGRLAISPFSVWVEGNGDAGHFLGDLVDR
jgi:hypothetical protein